MKKHLIDHLKNEIQVNCKYKGNFTDIKELLEKELKSQDIINKDEKLVDEQKGKVKHDELDMNRGILKLSKSYGKKLAENDNFTGFNNGFIPPYIYYKQDNKFIIEVECAGEWDKEMAIEANKRKENIIFKIKGKKIYPDGKRCPLPFDFSFQINVEKEKIKIETKSINDISPTFEKGIYKKEFPILNWEKQRFEFEK